MFRRILSIFAAAPFHCVLELVDPKEGDPDVAKEVARNLGYRMLSPRCLLLLIAINHFEKKGMLHESGNYKFYFDDRGRFRLVKEELES